MERVTGIGGIFFKSQDPEGLGKWYERHLGLTPDGYGCVVLKWREWADGMQPGSTVWGPFAADTQYFAPSTAPFMINYRVADLDGLLTKLREEGVAVEEKVQEESYGRFAWLMDPEGNRIELWQPVEEDKAPAFPLKNCALPGLQIHDANLENASFDDVNLTGATFNNISLRGARFTDVSFAGATIDESCIEGLTINGFDVLALIRAEQARRQEAEAVPA